MTTLQLLVWIVGALAVQVAAGVAAAAIRYCRLVRQVPGAPPPGASPARGPLLALRLRGRRYEDAAHTQCSFLFEPADGAPVPTFLPGQYLTFEPRFDAGGQLQRTAPGSAGAPPGRPVTRCYSLSGPPRQDHLRITVKRVPAPARRTDLPAGLVSNALHDQLREGDVLHARAPAGDFHLDDTRAPLVLVAGGIGITPILAMALHCLAAQPGREIDLFYGIANAATEAFGSELRTLARQHPNLQLHIVHSRPGTGERTGADYDAAGHIDIALLQQRLGARFAGTAAAVGERQYYCCGPAGLLASLVPALRAAGVPEAAIHYEAFGPASIPRPPGEPARAHAEHDVRFARTQRVLRWTGEDASLLDFAERHHVALESGCRTGQCGACELRLLGGVVRYAHTPGSTPPAGHCLPCIALPTTDVTLDA